MRCRASWSSTCSCRRTARPAPPTSATAPWSPRGGARIAFSTDSYVVKPMFFPGGSIGDLAVNGTVNDLAMSGATPLYLSTAFILQEGTDAGGRRPDRAGDGRWPAQAAGVRLVTGDTKVVDNGSGDGVYREHGGHRPGRATASTSARGGPRRRRGADQRRHRRARGGGDELPGGPGVRRPRCPATPRRCTGWSRRCWPPAADVHVLRDPTRGGVAASLNEIARAVRRRCRARRARPAGAGRGARRLQPARPGPAAGGQRGQAAGVRAADRPPTRCWRRCGPTRSAPVRGGSARASPSIPGWWSPRPRSAAPG